MKIPCRMRRGMPQRLQTWLRVGHPFNGTEAQLHPSRESRPDAYSQRRSQDPGYAVLQMAINLQAGSRGDLCGSCPMAACVSDYNKHACLPFLFSIRSNRSTYRLLWAPACDPDSEHGSNWLTESSAARQRRQHAANTLAALRGKCMLVHRVRLRLEEDRPAQATSFVRR